MELSEHKKRRILLFVAGFVPVLILCIAVTWFYVNNKCSIDKSQMEQVLLNDGNKISNVITKLLYKTEVLSALVVQSNGEVKEFDKVAATILDDPAVKNVLIAPNGVVSAVYPKEGNEAVVGLNFFAEGAGNKEAIQARDSGQLVLGGPFELVQGGQALVGRLPVYIDGENGEKSFWGLVSVTLKYPDALNGAELEQLQSRGLAYEIWRISPDTGERQTILKSNYKYNERSNFVERPLNILNAEWWFRISPVKSWYQYPEMWILSLGSLLLALILGFLMQRNYDLKCIENQLKALSNIDPLTNILNRRGFISTLNEQMLLGNRLTLCYMDLNGFKQVNDNHGHHMGDEVLKRFADAIRKNLGSNDIFGRLGGDEFALVFSGDRSDEDIQVFYEEVKRTLANERKRAPYDFQFSTGKAKYPDECKDIEELLHTADIKMYANKKEMKAQATG